ncbi:MAG: PAS domain S-box protein [Planctomycetales bacterium]|nr:PAS domain S-box protein [Planctomycetales bacterium]
MRESRSHNHSIELSDANFRAVADYTYDWESWHAPSGKLVWVNPAVERLAGYSPEECLQMEDYPLQMVAPQCRPRIVEILAEARSGTSGNDYEFEILHRSGELRGMAVSWQPMYNEPRQHLGFRTSVRDITERHKFREQIRLHVNHLEQLVQERTARISQLERGRRKMEKLAALGQLAAGVAHEINNPLAGIRNAFELIKSEYAPDHHNYELLELVDREIERISTITHHMYQLYRRTPQPPNEFSMERVVGEVAYLLESVARKRSVTLETKSQAPSVRVCLCEGEVKQILYNLITNAIQASPAGETVCVRTAQLGEEVRVTVSDRGAGIAPELLPYIFDPFFSTKSNEPKSGMGLGLSVSRSLIEAMGGSIDLMTSTQDGSRFTAIFPVRFDSPLARGDE